MFASTAFCKTGRETHGLFCYDLYIHMIEMSLFSGKFNQHLWVKARFGCFECLLSVVERKNL